MKKTIKTIATATAVVSATALTVNEKAKENQETKVAQAENDAQVAQQTAQNAVNQKQSEVDKLNSQLSSVNTITLSVGYADAIKAYSNSQNPDEWATLKNKIQQVANPGMEINTYKHNENDAKIQVDYKNLTLE